VGHAGFIDTIVPAVGIVDKAHRRVPVRDHLPGHRPAPLALARPFGNLFAFPVRKVVLKTVGQAIPRIVQGYQLGPRALVGPEAAQDRF
jgi:hypothetical protein